jgi:hypothetical protein
MMKRTFLSALGASLLALAAPAAALAHHHSKHHAACARTHKHHAKCAHARAHVLSFGPIAATPANGAPTMPSPTPSTETAGVVKSYAAPVLTITLNDKTEVSGKVTEATRLECESSSPSGEGDDDGPDEGASDDGSSTGTHDDARIADFHEGDEDEGDDDGGPQPCTATSLTPGTVVRAAELVLGGSGAIWEKVILVS